ncbi:MAG: argininosuccinate synthase, partial [Candidatus Sumerlaeota bacterium]
CEVIAFSAELGAGEDLSPLKQKAVDTGASKCIIEDLREEFARDFIVPAIQANALYEGRYQMHTSLGRPLIAKYLVDIAHAEGADAIAHGCTGKGNDQVRLEVVSAALGPELTCIAPVREWDMKTRDDEIDYARKHNIPVKVTKEKPYSIDTNIWGTAIECGVLEDPNAEPPEDAWPTVVSPEKAPDTPAEVEITFEKGVPTEINGVARGRVDLIVELNELAAANAVGRIDMVENRLVGIKSRELYEAPAAMLLIRAHQELETMALDREMMHFKPMLTEKFAELIYNGLWYSPLREAISAFFAKTNEVVSGKIKLRLYKGNVTVIGRECPTSLYDMALATYDEGDLFDHSAAEGFIKIFGLPSKVIARKQK